MSNVDEQRDFTVDPQAQPGFGVLSSSPAVLPWGDDSDRWRQDPQSARDAAQAILARSYPEVGEQRPAGHYASHLTTRWADGTTTEKSWTETLTAEEATARMGPVPVAVPPQVPPLWWSPEHGVIERQAREGSAFYGEYRPVGTVRWMTELPDDAVRLVADAAWAPEGVTATTGGSGG